MDLRSTMEEKDLKFPGFWIPHEIVLNMWGFFLLQLRRMQEMIAQMQAQMRMKPGDD